MACCADEEEKEAAFVPWAQTPVARTPEHTKRMAGHTMSLRQWRREGWMPDLSCNITSECQFQEHK